MRDGLEEVCEDRNSKWYYHSGVKKYFRIFDWGETRKISGRFLPDPDFLWAKRIEANPEANAFDLKPSEATFCLWKHWSLQK